MPLDCVQENGAPSEIRIDYKFYKDQQKIDVELNWFDKQAYRLPEASWFSFSLKVNNENLWKMDKMGEMVCPLEVVKNGNRNLHGVNSGVYYQGSDGRVSIKSMDAALSNVIEEAAFSMMRKAASLLTTPKFHEYRSPLI